MELWALFVIAAVVLAVGEIASAGFVLGPFALSALGAAGVAALGGGAIAAWTVFVVGGVLLLAFVRPVARRHLYTPPQLRTGTAALQGVTGVVLERVADEAGTARINGEVWTARSFDGDVIEAGTRVQVVEIRGATALVIEE